MNASMQDGKRPVFAAADGLLNASKFCATISRADPEKFFDRSFIPLPSDDTATVTFISVNGKYYAVTAHHVVEAFRQQSGDIEPLFVPASPGIVINSPFIRPPADLIRKAPDISLAPIMINQIPEGKDFFDIKDICLNRSPEFCVAYGFPTRGKSTQIDHSGERLKLQAVRACIEGVGSDLGSDQIQFYSEVPSSEVSGDVSGMSGGPVFWSEGEEYGLLGFVKEAMVSNLLPNDMLCLSLICQRMDYVTICQWIEYVDQESANQRRRL